jgi:hypothetical protein
VIVFARHSESLERRARAPAFHVPF